MSVFKKLQLKDHKTMLCISPPQQFIELLLSLPEGVSVYTKTNIKQVGFIIGFVKSENDLKVLMQKIEKYLQLDTLLWICYPKKTSKNFTSTINRDNGWLLMGDYGLEAVSAVAIDEDWSGLRFKQATQIKTLNRTSGILSKEGLAKAKNVNKIGHFGTTKKSNVKLK